jgi:hypothetical protein
VTTLASSPIAAAVSSSMAQVRPLSATVAPWRQAFGHAAAGVGDDADLAGQVEAVHQLAP